VKAVYLEAPNTFSVIDRPDPEPSGDQARLRVITAGVCGSDMSLFRGTNPVGAYPLTPGHECVGEVEWAPPGAAVAPGDWVALYPSVGCGRCAACREERYNHCPEFRVLGINRDGGCFAERMAVPVHQLIPIPPALRGPDAAIVEPMAVAVHVNRRAETKTGDRVLVVGTGVVGLLGAAVARAMGAGEILFVDRLPERRRLVEALGFHHFRQTDAGPTAPWVRETLGSVDLVLDSVCSDETVADGLDVLVPGGRLVLVASPKGRQRLSVDFTTVFARELSLVATRNYVPQDFRDAIALLVEGKVEPGPLITGRFPLADFAAAIDALGNHPERHVKVFVEP